MKNKSLRTNKSLWSNHPVYIGMGVAALLILWQVLSMVFPRIIIASPAATLSALIKIASDGSLWSHFGYSLARLLIGLGISSLIGVSLGILAGLYPRLRLFLEPLRWVVMTIPAIIITVLALLWFGMGSLPVVFIIAVITLPFTYVNTLEGMLAVDARIIEMVEIYKVPSRLRLMEIYLPGTGAAVMAGLTLASGVGVRAVILAEFLSARNGIGHSLFLSWTFLDTPALFAWILLAFALLGLVEFGVLKPIRDYLMRWKRTA